MPITVLKSCFRVLAWLYPLSIWFLHDRVDHKPLALGLFALFTLEWLFTRPAARRAMDVLAVVLGALAMMQINPEHTVRLYPFLMAISMLNIFIRTKNPADNPMIGPMRRFVELDENFLRLLHQAKWIWIVGLGFNSAIFLVFLFAFDNRTWALYASFYSYLWLLFLFLLSVAYIGVKRKRLL